MDAGEGRSPSREGPFTILGGVAGLGAIVLAAVTLLLPVARLVTGGLLLGIAIGAVATWVATVRRQRRHGSARPPVLVPLIALGCGVFLLLAPTFLALPQPPTAAGAEPADGRGSAHLTSPAITATPSAAPTVSPSSSPGPSASGSPGAATGSTEGGLPDQYLADLTSNRQAKTGAISGPGYQLSHGLAYPLGPAGGQASDNFVVPSRYHSMSLTLKAVSATMRFAVYLPGSNLPAFDQTIAATQPAVAVTCEVPEGQTVRIEVHVAGNVVPPEATAAWGDAKFSVAAAPTRGCA